MYAGGIDGVDAGERRWTLVGGMDVCDGGGGPVYLARSFQRSWRSSAEPMNNRGRWRRNRAAIRAI
jgi:hypothetical protein